MSDLSSVRGRKTGCTRRRAYRLGVFIAAVVLLLLVSAHSSRSIVEAQDAGAPQPGVAVSTSFGGSLTTDEIMRRDAIVASMTDGASIRITPRLVAPRPQAILDRSDLYAFADSSSGGGMFSASVPLTFAGATLVETQTIPPDTMGAAGPTQFIVAVNGRIRTFAKSTGAADGVLNTTMNTFFASVRGTAASVFSPRIRYDRLSGRWFVTIVTDSSPGRLLIASSNQGTIGATTVWSFFSFDNTFTPGTCLLDSPTLGVDVSALYIGANQFCGGGTSYSGTSAFVVRKSSALDAGPLAVTAFHNLTTTPAGTGPFAPHGVDNDDPAAAFGYFIGVDNASLGQLVVRRVTSPGATPALSDNILIPVAATAQPIRVRHLGNLGGTNGQLDGGDDRLASAKMTGGRLWTAQTIGVTETGQASATATRNGVRWYEIQSLDATPSVVQSGTLNSSALPGSVDARNYWVPSIAISAQGRAVIGYSAAGTQEYANAGVAERYPGDAAGSLQAPTLYTSSISAYNPSTDQGSATRGRRWGGYSETTVDPCDNQTIWTVQQYTDALDSYAVQVGRVLAPPPAALSAAAPASVSAGQASVNVTITGTSSGGAAFFDPGAGFTCRIAGSVAGGVTVNSVTYSSPTSVTLNVSTLNATPGVKAITITNPDGQTATSSAIFSVLPGPVMQIDSPVTGNAAQPLTVQGWAIDGAGAGTGVDAVHVYATPQGGAGVFLGAATYGVSRPDVAAAYGAQFTASGFTITAGSVLAPGPYTITAYAHSTATNTFNNAASVSVTLTAGVPPFGALETPADNTTVSGEVAFTGWALDDAGVAAVDIYRDPVAGEPNSLVYIGRATIVRGARPDVQAAFPNVPNNDSAGWGYMVLSNFLPNQGNGAFTLHAYATDYAGLSTLLGTRRMTGANAASALPFGSIDTPGQGATVSGTIVNFGWALAPQPRIVPTNGLTIDVYVDGVLQGHPVYNQYRPDIATLFPGLRNTDGAVGYFYIDTTKLTNGLHTISWVIRDDVGNAAGVGSRFFRVQN